MVAAKLRQAMHWHRAEGHSIGKEKLSVATAKRSEVGRGEDMTRPCYGTGKNCMGQLRQSSDRRVNGIAEKRQVCIANGMAVHYAEWQGLSKVTNRYGRAKNSRHSNGQAMNGPA